MGDLTTALNLFAIFLLIACLGLWGCCFWFGKRFTPRRWLFAPSDSPLAVWGLADLFAIFVIYVLFELGAAIVVNGGVADSTGEDATGKTSQITTSSSPDAIIPSSPDATTSSKPEADVSAASSQLESATNSESPADEGPESTTPAGSSASASAKTMATIGTARLLSLFAMLAWIAVRYRASLREIGIVPGRVGTDILLGLTASVMLLPLVIGMQSLLTLMINYEHSTMTQVTTHQSGAVIAAAFLSAGIAAPFLEEYLYRVFLQGWIDKFMNGLWIVRHSTDKDAEFQQAAWVVIGGRDSHQLELREQDRAASTDDPDPSPPNAKPRSSKSRPLMMRMVPVIMASTLFALAHFGQGPAPIPLFFFAVGVGSLFAFTQRALPCIVVHLVLNFWSLTILTIGVLNGTPSAT